MSSTTKAKVDGDKQMKMVVDAMTELPFSDDLAVQLGLKKSIHSDRQEMDEVNKSFFFDAMIKRIYRECEEQREIIFSRFAALYLPAVVDHFFELPAFPDGFTSPPGDILLDEIQELKNPYMVALVHTQHLPYFSKYLRSTKPQARRARQLPEALAERIANLAPRLDSPRMFLNPDPVNRTYYIDLVAQVCQLLSSVLLTYSREKDRRGIISERTKRRLIPYLREWTQRYPPRSTDLEVVEIGNTAQRVLWYLEECSVYIDAAQTLRKGWKGMSACAVPGCGAQGNLKVFSRCQTVAYCSPAHQKQHWSSTPFMVGHKDLCHKTEY